VEETKFTPQKQETKTYRNIDKGVDYVGCHAETHSYGPGRENSTPKMR